MNNTVTTSNQRIDHVLSTLNKYRVVWIAPAILGMLLSAVYVLLIRQETWSAKQSLIVRDDLLGQSFKPGRFDSIELMKSAQETILEIARKPQVIRNTLEQLGPASKGWFGLGNRNWPSEEIIEDVQGSITFTAPNGAEFGKTEVIVLNTKATTRERSRKFIEVLLNEIVLKVDEVRSLRLRSMELELTQVRDSAMAALEQSSAKLQEMDELLGTDVGAMNVLNDSQSNDNTIKRDISQIHLEKRQTEVLLESLKTVVAQLKDAKENPNRIVSISGDLIKYQPALDDLKKEIIKTQRELAVMAGQYESEHPRLQHAKDSLGAMKQHLYLELDSSIDGLQHNISVTEKRLARLDLELGNLDGRLISLGSKRADMVTLFADLRKRSEIANNAQSDLAEIQGLLRAKNADLLTRVDDPQVNTRPDGLSKKAMVFAGGLGGLMLGLGVVMLIAPPIGTEENRISVGPSEASKGDSNPESFFDSQTFEKILKPAVAAATHAAMVSATKAKQYFASLKADQTKNSDTSGTSAINRPSAGQASPDEASFRQASAKSNNDSAENNDVRPGTPSVKDLLAAASAMATPAPIASQPLSSNLTTPLVPDPPMPVQHRSEVKSAIKRSAKIRPAQKPIPVDSPVQPESSSVPPESSPVPPESSAVEPASAPVQPESAPVQPEEVVEFNKSTAATLPVEELASIQLAALRGTIKREQESRQPQVADKDVASPATKTAPDEKVVSEAETFVPTSETAQPNETHQSETVAQNDTDAQNETTQQDEIHHEIVARTKTAVSQIPVVSDLESNSRAADETATEPTATEPIAIETTLTDESVAQPSDFSEPKAIDLVVTPAEQSRESFSQEESTPIQPESPVSPPPVREEPQTIVVSNMLERAAQQIEAQSPRSNPIEATTIATNPVTELTRRGPNVRPVDLAKSVVDDDATFVRVTQKPTPKDDKADQPSDHQPTRSPNPFLKDRKSSSDSSSNEPDSNTAVPDQIKKLSESIANFAKPIPKPGKPTNDS